LCFIDELFNFFFQAYTVNAVTSGIPASGLLPCKEFYAREIPKELYYAFPYDRRFDRMSEPGVHHNLGHCFVD